MGLVSLEEAEFALYSVCVCNKSAIHSIRFFV